MSSSSHIKCSAVASFPFSMYSFSLIGTQPPEIIYDDNSNGEILMKYYCVPLNQTQELQHVLFYFG